MSSAEQQARDLLDRLEVDGAQNYSAGEIVELANLIAERNHLARVVAQQSAALQRVKALTDAEAHWLNGCAVIPRYQIIAALDDR